MENYFVTIGIEVHAELKTNTKMFCSCKNDVEEKTPNTNICPICMAHPGTLPTLNKKAIESVLKVGKAIGGKLANFTEWDRKNYFYPDIPKGYQLSQYKHPLVEGGEIAGVKITRIHLEEDTAKSNHEKKGVSLIDYNRAGLPLMELVTEPVIHDAKTASKFATELQLLLRELNVSDANMEKGQMRVEVNISISKDKDKFGTKVEIKNLNSFKSAERSIEYEIKRHFEILESGGKIVQETRGFDENTGKTFTQRIKENSDDYRYFPEPDLPKLYINELDLDLTLPELPNEIRNRYKEYNVKDEDIEVFLQNRDLRDIFEKAVKLFNNDFLKTISNYILSDLQGFSKKGLNVDINEFYEIMKFLERKDIVTRVAKDLIIRVANGEKDIANIIEKEGLINKLDENKLKEIIENILKNNANSVEEYKNGKASILQFLVGQVMKEMKGAVDAEIAKNKILELMK